MAYNHDVILSFVERPPCLVRNWDALELYAALEGERGYCMEGLVNEGS
jgi:hypothetical protein